jgi:Restriction endonuclease BsobI
MIETGNSVGNKNSGQPYQIHLSNKADLITSHVETRSGFLELALEKNRQATPFITQARALKAVASPLVRPADLLTLTTIQPALVAAAGISDKAASHLDATTKEQAVQDFIMNFLDTAGID